MSEIEISKGFNYWPWQNEIRNDNHRIQTLRSGRQIGKSLYGARRLGLPIMKNGGIGLAIAPTNKMLKRTQAKYLLNLFAPLIKRKLLKYNASDLYFEFSDKIGGGLIYLYTAEEPDKIRGFAQELDKPISQIWIDEAAHISKLKYIWEDVLGILQLYKPGILITSTPTIRNFFWELCNRGDSEEDKFKEYKSFHYSCRENPLFTEEKIKAFVEANELTPQTYKMEIEGEFGDIETGVFGNWEKCSQPYGEAGRNPYRNIKPEKDHRYLISADIAQVYDWCVIYIVDQSTKPNRIVWKEKFKRKDSTEMAEVLRILSKDYNGGKVYVDKTGGGIGVYDILKNKCNLVGVAWSSASKPKMVSDLAFVLQSELLHFSKYDEDLTEELILYRGTTSETGHVKYSAPSGYHDDHVSALMNISKVIRHYVPETYEVVAAEKPNPYRDEYRLTQDFTNMVDFIQSK